MPIAEIFGVRRTYKVKDLAGILEKRVKELKSGGDPPEYCCEDVEKLLEGIAKDLKIKKMKVYV